MQTYMIDLKSKYKLHNTRFQLSLVVNKNMIANNK